MSSSPPPRYHWTTEARSFWLGRALRRSIEGLAAEAAGGPCALASAAGAVREDLLYVGGGLESAVQAGFAQTRQDLVYEVTGGAVVAVGGVGLPAPAM